MQIHTQNTELILHLGRLRGEYRIPMTEVDSWDLWYQPLGRRFLAFHTGDRTHYINLPRLSPDARQTLLADLSRLLGRAPSVEMFELERDNSHWQAAWEVIKQIGRYLRLFINPRAPLK